MKKAFITGVTGQDGSYLTEFLVNKGYKVFGFIRPSSSFNTHRIDHLIECKSPSSFDWERGDLSDSDSLLRALKKIEPDEIYHLAAQTHVKESFNIPVFTFDTVATGTVRLLEVIRALGLKSKIYNASSSEMFGAALPPQDENTIFKPRSPYAVGKVAAFNMAINYRQAYGMFISNGILFNHESPRRGETFVTRKITRAVSRIAYGIQDRITLGNLNSKRDWGYSPEYVEAMWLMLQQEKADDFVIATGESHSVKEFVEKAFNYIGIIIEWKGKNFSERGLVSKIRDTVYSRHLRLKRKDVVIDIDKRFFRPTDVDYLLGNPAKAMKILGWKPKTTFNNLVKIMMKSDLKRTNMLLKGTKKYKEEWRQHIA